MTEVFHPLAATARARPEHPVLITPQRNWRARELAEHVARVANSLRLQGLQPGTPVALCGPACSDWVIALHAIGWAGGIACPVGPGQAIDSSIAFAVSTGAELPARVHALDLTAANLPLPEPMWPLGEVRLWMTTSGSTGVAKTIPLTSGQLLFSAMGSTIRLGHQLADRWLCCLPLHHIGGLSILLRTAWLATCAEVHPRFDAELVNRRIDSGEVSQISLVPTMLARLLDARSQRPFPASLRTVLLGGAACSDELRSRCTKLGVPVAYTWGMTETASQVATSFVGKPPTQPGEVGPPLAFAKVHQPHTTGGQLVVTGPVVGGTLPTADCGHLDAMENVHVHGRRDRVIISGGENVDPVRVEQTLRDHPQVEDVSVFGVPDPTWGQRVAAVLVATCRPDGNRTPPDPTEFETWFRGQLAPHERPRQLAWCHGLPRTTTDKLPRAALLQLLTAAQPPHAPLGGR